MYLRSMLTAKIIIFTAVKNHCVLHGRVFVMILFRHVSNVLFRVCRVLLVLYFVNAKNIEMSSFKSSEDIQKNEGRHNSTFWDNNILINDSRSAGNET